jgi:hypothetical protein
VDALELLPGVDAEPVGQEGPDPLVGGEGFGLAPRPVQGEHEPRPQELAQRVRGSESAEFGDQFGVAARFEHQVGAPLDGAKPLFDQRGNVSGDQPFGVDVDERVAAPQAQRPVEQRQFGGSGGVFGFGCEGTEPVDVDRFGVDVQGVLAGRGEEGLGADSLAQPVDDGVQPVTGGRGVLAPDERGESAAAHGFPGGEGEGGEDRPLSAAVNGLRQALGGDLERAEQSDSHRLCHGGAISHRSSRVAGPGRSDRSQWTTRRTRSGFPESAGCGVRGSHYPVSTTAPAGSCSPRLLGGRPVPRTIGEADAPRVAAGRSRSCATKSPPAPRNDRSSPGRTPPAASCERADGAAWGRFRTTPGGSGYSSGRPSIQVVMRFVA